MAAVFELVKSFRFSASHQSGQKVIGHNYVFRVAVRAADEVSERRLTEAVEETVISRVHSRDLTLHVDFLKGVPIADDTLLRAFWSQLEPKIGALDVAWMALERDERTQTRWDLGVSSGVSR